MIEVITTSFLESCFLLFFVFVSFWLTKYYITKLEKISNLDH